MERGLNKNLYPLERNQLAIINDRFLQKERNYATKIVVNMEISKEKAEEYVKKFN